MHVTLESYLFDNGAVSLSSVTKSLKRENRKDCEEHCKYTFIVFFPFLFFVAMPELKNTEGKI